jgi:hypothetical protein
MAALENLKVAIEQLSAKIDGLLAKPQGVAQADVQAAADAVVALNANIPE